MLFQITAPHFVAGIVVGPTPPNRCAPIVGFMKMWRLSIIQAYCRRKNWHLELIIAQEKQE